MAFLQNPFTPLSTLVALITFSVGAAAALIPQIGGSSPANSPFGPTTPLPAAEIPPAPGGKEGDDVLAEAAVLAWKILKRAEKDPETHKVILRHAGRILESLARCGIELVSYQGRKVDVGSNVQILDAIPGEYNRVLEESDPQVQRQGKLLRQAIVTVGNGQTPTPAPAHAAP